MSNTLTVSLSLSPPSTPSGVDLCVVTGYLLGVNGRPLKGVQLDYQNLYYPLGIGTDTLVLREHNYVVSDSTGKVEFEALRGSRLRFGIPNLGADMLFEGNVPEAATCDLLDIALPYVVSVVWDDASISVETGEVFNATLTGTLSDGTEIDVTDAVTVTIGDEDVVSESSDRYVGSSAGSTTLTAASIDVDLLEINQSVEGTVIRRLDVPAPTLPSPLAVTVT